MEEIMKKTILLFVLSVFITAGCSSGGGSSSASTVPQDVNSAVEAVLYPIIEFMSDGEQASVDNVVFQLTGNDHAVITYNSFHHSDTGLTVSGSLDLTRTISGTRVTLTISGTVTITGGTVDELVWDAAATGDYDASEDDFSGPPDELSGTITADGTEYPFSAFSSLMPEDSGNSDITITDPHFVVSGMEGTVVFSEDGSAWGWPNVAQSADTGVSSNLNNIACDSAGICLAVGNSGTILRSTNGTQWSSVSTDITGDLTAIAWSNGRWVTFVNAGTVYYSDNGLTWSAATVTNGTPDIMFDVAGDGAGAFIAVGSTLTSMVSTDNGETWTLIEPFHNDFNNYRSIAFGGSSTWVAAGDSGMIALSTDTGQTWTLAVSSGLTAGYLEGVSFGNGRFIAVGSNPASIISSADGDTWTNDSALLPAEFVSTGNPLTDLATDNTGRWSIVGSYGDHLLSTDNGTSWSVVALDLYGSYAISYRP